MRMLLWLLTIVFALAGLALREDHLFVGAIMVAQGCLLVAVLACPLLWSRPDGLFYGITGGVIMTGRDRLMLAFAILLSAPLTLPWPV